jgi:hypothetical protein
MSGPQELVEINRIRCLQPRGTLRRSRHGAGSSSPLGDRQRANDSLPHADPCDGPSLGHQPTLAGDGTCRNLSCFAALSSRSYGAATGSAFDLGRPSGRGTRGIDGPAIDVDSSLVNVCPLRERRSPRSDSQLENGPSRLHGTGGTRRGPAVMRTVAALAPTRVYGIAVVGASRN